MAVVELPALDEQAARHRPLLPEGVADSAHSEIVAPHRNAGTGNNRERARDQLVVVLSAYAEPIAVLHLDREVTVGQAGRRPSRCILDVGELANAGELPNRLDRF